MEHRVLVRGLISFAAAAVWMLFCLWAMGGQAFSSVDMLLRTFGLDDHTAIIMLAAAAGSAVVVFCACWQIAGNRLNRMFWRVLAGCYVAVLFAVVMLKSVGARGVNLDMADLLSQLIEYPVSVVVNLLLFVPVGAMVGWKLRRSVVALAVALAAIVVVEAVQYVLALGITDVVDVAVDFAGFCLGFAMADMGRLAGLRLVCSEDNRYLHFVRVGKMAPGVRTALRKKVALMIVIAAAIFVVLGIALANYEYDPYAFMSGMTQEEFEAAMRAGEV